MKGPRIIVWRGPVLTALACLLCACAGAEPMPNEVPGYVASPGPDDFPGVEVAAHAGELRPPTAPVWVVAVDGATWQLIRPMARAGELPNFAALMERGAWGELLSEEPTISPALWATIATGTPRFVHGVDNFLVKLPGSHETVEAGPADRRSPAIWDLVGAAGGRSAVISWFGSYPAEEIAGHYVSKGFDPEKLRPNQVHPASFIPALADTRIRLRPRDFNAIGITESFRRSLLADARALAAMETIAETESPDLLLAYFAGIDVVQHVTWRHMEPESQVFPQDGPPEPSLSDVIPAYYRFIDHALGQIRRRIPDDATLVVLSDHGAGPVRPAEAYHFQLEVLLETMGLMDGPTGKAFAIGELYRHDKRIWLNLAGVEEDGTVPLERAGEEALAVAQRLGALTADDGLPVFSAIEVLTDDPRWQPGDPALSVRFSRSALMSSEIRDGDRRINFDPVRLRHTDVSGSHRREGIVILDGPAIRSGRLESSANLYHVAPTLLYLLGLPQNARMLEWAPADGGVLESAIAPAWLEAHPVQAVPGYPGTDRTHLLRTVHAAESPDPARAESLEKLRSLGYIR